MPHCLSDTAALCYMQMYAFQAQHIAESLQEVVDILLDLQELLFLQHRCRLIEEGNRSL